MEWVLALTVMILWALKGRTWSDMGMGAPEGPRFWIGFFLALALMAAGTWQRLTLSGSNEERVRQSVLSHLESLRPLLPHSRRDMMHFGLVSLTAGICEEILFRGFLIWYLSALVPQVPALLIAALLFGMAHAYQGTRGVIQTGIVGLGLVALYVLTETLWVPMAVHLFVDLNSGLLAYTFLARAETKDRDPPSPPSQPTL